MSSDTILRDSEGREYSFDNLSTQRWLDGHESGLDLAAGWLRERAVGYFRQGKDEEATRLRKMADEMQAEISASLRLRCATHQREYPILLPDHPPRKKRT